MRRLSTGAADDGADARRDRRVTAPPEGASTPTPGSRACSAGDPGRRPRRRPNWPASSSTRSRWRSCRGGVRAPGSCCYALGDDDLVEGVSRIHIARAERAPLGGMAINWCAVRTSRPAGSQPRRRTPAALPKAHLHLHFTGWMRPHTLLEPGREARASASRTALTCGRAATCSAPPTSGAGSGSSGSTTPPASCVRDEADMRRIVHEAAEDDARGGSRRLEMQVDPTSYAAARRRPHPGARDRARRRPRGERRHRLRGRDHRRRQPRSGTRWTPAPWRGSPPGTPATGSGQVVGFGLSNDERRGSTTSSPPPSASPARAGLAAVPHSGELLGPAHVRTTLDNLAPDRLGHGVRVAPRTRRCWRASSTPASRSRSARRQRRARRLPDDVRGAAAGARRRRRADRAGRRRPAAVRAAARRPVPRGARGARLRRRRAGRAGPRVGARSRAPSDLRADMLRGVDAWIAAPA